MDVEPIYCAEQIVVPPNLADVLKQYTKEVLRRQPADLIEFSALYFKQLSRAAKAAQAIQPPSKEQIKATLDALRGAEAVPAAQLTAAAEQAGVPPATVARVLEIGQYDVADLLEVRDVLLLMLTMVCENFATTVHAMFEVFGQHGQLAVLQVLALLGFLARRDADLSSALMTELEKSLMGYNTIDYALLADNPVLRAKLAVI